MKARPSEEKMWHCVVLGPRYSFATQSLCMIFVNFRPWNFMVQAGQKRKRICGHPCNAPQMWYDSDLGFFLLELKAEMRLMNLDEFGIWQLWPVSCFLRLGQGPYSLRDPQVARAGPADSAEKALSGKSWGTSEATGTVDQTRAKVQGFCLDVFPECVARVPVSLWGPGSWKCVSLDVVPPFATVRNRSREVAMAVPLQRLRKPAARLGEVFFLRTKWAKGVWGQSWQNPRFWSIFVGHVPDGNWVTVGYRFPHARSKGIAWKGPWRYNLGGDIETGIEWGQRQRHCLERWIRWELNGYFSVCLSLTLPAVSVGLRCGTIMVARIRRNFCQYTDVKLGSFGRGDENMKWGWSVRYRDWNRMEWSEARGNGILLGKVETQ